MTKTNKDDMPCLKHIYRKTSAAQCVVIICLACILGGPLRLYAQQPISWQRPLATLQDSLQWPATGVVADTINATHTKAEQLLGKVDSIHSVYADKTLRQHFDSLLANGFIPPAALQDKPALDKEAYMQQLHEAFEKPLSQADPSPPNPHGSLPQSGDYGQWQSKVPGLPTDMGDFGLAEAYQGQLAPLKGYQLDTGLIRQAGQWATSKKDKHMPKLRHFDGPNGWQNIEVAPASTFADRWYLEGVLGLPGLMAQGGEQIQISPAFAYRFYGPLSVGAGPNIQITTTAGWENAITAVGLRSFLKAMFLADKAYAQLEHMYANNVPQENSSIPANNFYLGGGYLLRLSPRVAANIMVLYHLNEGQFDFETDQSPWLLRLGLSTFRQ